MIRRQVRHQRVASDGVELHVATVGDGPPVLMLHGFPDNWTTWSRQADPLADAGFSALMPDLRGYGGSDRPPTRHAYRLRQLVADVVSLIGSRGAGPVTLVGHDWGGVIAWVVASDFAPLIRRLVILNAPHPRIYLRRVLTSSQALRSWYVLAAQVPVLAEALLSAHDHWTLRRVLAIPGAGPGSWEAERIDAVVAELSRPGALTAALRYYRANAWPSRLATTSEKITVPTLVLWGERDRALSTTLLEGLTALVDDLRVVRFPAAGHWVHLEEPAAVNRELLDFITA